MSFDPNDFLALVSCADRTETERLVRKIFSSVDANDNGFIDKEEMHAMMRHFANHMSAKTGTTPSEEEVVSIADAAIAQMDANADGKLSLEEFLKFAFAQNNC